MLIQHHRVITPLQMEGRIQCKKHLEQEVLTGQTVRFEPITLTATLTDSSPVSPIGLMWITIAENTTMDSDSTSSTSDSSVERRKGRSIKPHAKTTVKKRKTTYDVRKDQIQELQAQVQHLEAQLAQQERHAPEEKVTLTKTQRWNRMLAHGVEQNGLAVAGAQAHLSAYNLTAIKSFGLVPLHDYIHLPANHDERNTVLASLYESKIHKTLQFMTERIRGLELRAVHKQVEEFDLPDGHMGVIGMNILPITSGHSVRQVLDALVSFVKNQEISFSERMGILTIRESEDLDDFRCSQTRLLSTMPGDVQIESNVTMFATYVDATDDEPPYALASIDYVDQDDLYPYRSETCLRKDTTVGLLMREVPSLVGGTPTITLLRWYYIRMLPSPFPLSEHVKEMVYTTMIRWCDSIPTIIKEGLMTMTPAYADIAL